LRTSSRNFWIALWLRDVTPTRWPCFISAIAMRASGRIVGVDISSDMNSIASKRVAAFGFGDRVEILEGDATALGFADAVFEAAVSMQVIEYLAEPDAALHELARVLRPGGRLVIIDTDWDSLVWAATDRRRAARIATAWNEHLPDPYLPRSLAPRLRAAGFEVREIRIVPILNTAYDATTFSYNIAPLIAAFVPGHGGTSEDEATEWLNDLAELQHQAEDLPALWAAQSGLDLDIPHANLRMIRSAVLFR
jgi:arsenite methyltransferase